MPKEAKARILINNLLQRSGWRFFDDENGHANIALEANVKLKKKILDGLGEDFEKTANGFVDYHLLDERGFPMGVLEAKSEKYDPLVGGPLLMLGVEAIEKDTRRGSGRLKNTDPRS